MPHTVNVRLFRGSRPQRGLSCTERARWVTEKFAYPHVIRGLWRGPTGECERTCGFLEPRTTRSSTLMGFCSFFVWISKPRLQFCYIFFSWRRELDFNFRLDSDLIGYLGFVRYERLIHIGCRNKDFWITLLLKVQLNQEWLILSWCN